MVFTKGQVYMDDSHSKCHGHELGWLIFTDTHTHRLTVIFQVNLVSRLPPWFSASSHDWPNTLHALPSWSRQVGVAHVVLWAVPNPLTLTTIARGFEAEDFTG